MKIFRINKKFLILCCSLLIGTLFLTACTNNSLTPQNTTTISEIGSGCVISTGYYRTENDGKMIFYDFKSKQTVPVCNKPNCPHTKKSECSAYAQNEGSFIAYGDYLYYFVSESASNTAIIRTDADGSNQIKIAEDSVSTPGRMIADNQCIYYMAPNMVFDKDGSGGVSSGQVIHSLDLQTNQVKPILNGENDPHYSPALMGVKGNYLFFFDFRSGEEENQQNNKKVFTLGAIDLTTMEKKIIKETPDCCNDYFNRTGFYFLEKRQDNKYDVQKIDFDTLETSTLFTVDEFIIFLNAFDDKVVYYPASEIGSVSRTGPVTVYDIKTQKENALDWGNDIDSITVIDEHENNYIVCVWPKDGNAYYAEMKKEDYYNGILEYTTIYIPTPQR